jgi:hypothetical protein
VNTKHPLIIGSGRMAKHLYFYFQNLGLNPLQWSRAASDIPTLSLLCPQALSLWIAVSDHAIEEVLDLLVTQKNLLTYETPFFHLSGTHLSKRALDLHFLGSFSDHLFDSHFYPKLPLITSHPKSAEILKTCHPEILNSVYLIPEEQKPLYHSACVLGGPGSITLWWQMNEILQSMGLPKSVTQPYVETLVTNWLQQKTPSLTGPWPRKDHKTIEKNKDALEANYPLTKELYTYLEKQYLCLNSQPIPPGDESNL